MSAERIAFPLRRLQGARLSEMARCPRMSAYSGRYEERRDWTDMERRYLTRGRLYGRFVADQLALVYGPDAVEFERVVRWPGGEGHIDVYVKPERLIVEVVSTVSPSPLMLGFKMDQARQYLHFDAEAERAQVYVIDPSSLAREEAIPVVLTDEHRAEIDARTAAVVAAVEGGPLPERVCSKPSEARSHLCPYAETCFAGWEPPPRDELAGEARIHAAELWRRELALKQAKASAAAAKHDRDEARAALLAEGLEPGETAIGDVLVQLSDVKPRETFSLANARKSGVWTPLDDERLAPFVSLSEPGLRWRVSRLEEGDLLSADDFGDEVPW